MCSLQRRHKDVLFQEISNSTHGSRTPKKPEYLIARSQLTERGPWGIGPIPVLMDLFDGVCQTCLPWIKGDLTGFVENQRV